MLTVFAKKEGYSLGQLGVCTVSEMIAYLNRALKAYPQYQKQFKSPHKISSALGCAQCHGPQGVLDWPALGYTPQQVERLAAPQQAR